MIFLIKYQNLQGLESNLEAWGKAWDPQSKQSLFRYVLVYDDMVVEVEVNEVGLISDIMKTDFVS